MQNVQHGVPQLVLVADAARILGKRQNVQPDCPAGEEQNRPAFKTDMCFRCRAAFPAVERARVGEGPLGVPH